MISEVQTSYSPDSGSAIVSKAQSDYQAKNNNNIYTYQTKNVLFCPEENIKTDDVQYSNIEYSSVNKAGYIYEPNQNILQITNLNPFYYKSNSNYGFINQSREEIPLPPNNGAAGLYINNKQSLGVQVTGDQRLFCCAKNSNDVVKNIFSIKKDGSLYMGGNLCDINLTPLEESQKIPDEIAVQNADIWISNGVMHLDFHKIVDKDNTPLDEAISTAVEGIKLVRHRHEIQKLMGSFEDDNEVFAYLPTNEDLSFRFDLSADGVPEKSLYDYIESHPAFGFRLMIDGTGTIHGNYGSVQVKFSRKLPIIGEDYVFNCINSFTEYAGTGSEGGSGHGSFNGWGYVDPIQG